MVEMFLFPIAYGAHALALNPEVAGSSPAIPSTGMWRNWQRTAFRPSALGGRNVLVQARRDERLKLGHRALEHGRHVDVVAIGQDEHRPQAVR